MALSGCIESDSESKPRGKCLFLENSSDTFYMFENRRSIVRMLEIQRVPKDRSRVMREFR